MKRHQGRLRASRLFLVERPAENQSQEARPHRLNEGQPIGEVVLKPGPKRGQVDAELRGELMGTLDFTLGHENQRAGEVRTNVVAHPGLEPT
jgi:hypothetical protein